jgi:hypothetical protein
MATGRLARKTRPFWERGYKSHGYWAGRRKLGVVRLRDDVEPEEKYRWEAGTHAGFSATLAEAKRAVEEAVLLGTSQLPLFQTEVEQVD